MGDATTVANVPAQPFNLGLEELSADPKTDVPLLPVMISARVT